MKINWGRTGWSRGTQNYITTNSVQWPNWSYWRAIFLCYYDKERNTLITQLALIMLNLPHMSAPAVYQSALVFFMLLQLDLDWTGSLVYQKTHLENKDESMDSYCSKETGSEETVDTELAKVADRWRKGGLVCSIWLLSSFIFPIQTASDTGAVRFVSLKSFITTTLVF